MSERFDPENIPEEMKQSSRWVLYSIFVNPYSNRVEKLPKSLNGKLADITKPESWTTFEKAYGSLIKNENTFSGLGFVLGDGIFGIDLDHVINQEGNIEPWAEEIVKRMDSYTEISPSGTGIHIYAKGKIPTRDRKNGPIEMYDEKRYFTVTGRCLGEPRPLAERTREAAAIHRQYLKRDHRESVSGAQRPTFTPGEAVRDVQDLVERASNAKNGEKFISLWKGDKTGYASQSQADQALCNFLAFYSGGQRDLMDAAFRSSGLMRSKWDSRRGNQTYGALTIEKALQALGTDGKEYTAGKSECPPPLPVDKKETGRTEQLEEQPVPPLSVDKKESLNVSVEQEDGLKAVDDLSLAEKTQDEGTVSLQDVLFRGFSLQDTGTRKVSTGIKGLDKRLSGGFGSGIILLGSEPGIGKTSLLLQIASHFALEGAPVYYLSFEQEIRFLSAKALSCLASRLSGSKVVFSEVLSGKANDALLRTCTDPRLSHFQFIRSSRIQNGEMLLAEMERLWESSHDYAARNGKPVIFCIDYLQIIPFSGPASFSVRAALDDFIRKLRQLQMRTGMCIVLVSSLNRMAYMGPVRMDSFRESGVIEFTGDVILGLNLRAMRSEEYGRLSDSQEKNARLEAARRRKVRELEITCLKNKYGESGFAVDVDFDTESGVFTERG